MKRFPRLQHCSSKGAVVDLRPVLADLLRYQSSAGRDMPQHGAGEAVVIGAWAICRNGANLLAGKEQAHSDITQRGAPVLVIVRALSLVRAQLRIVRAERAFDQLMIKWAFDIGGEEGIDDRRIKLCAVVLDQHLETIDNRGQEPNATMLSRTLSIKAMNNHRPAPFRFPGDPLPCHRPGGAEIITLMRFSDVIGHSCAVIVDLNSATHCLLVKAQLRVRKPVWIDDLHRRGISRTSDSDPFRHPPDHGKRIPI